MKYVLAVSGGVDSVVLLDMFLRKGKEQADLVSSSTKLGFANRPMRKTVGLSHAPVVAHFDHGMRDESAHDAEFVRGLASKYGVEFVLGEGKLGLNASEEIARKARYNFLWKVVAEKGKEQADLVSSSTKLGFANRPMRKTVGLSLITAHHQDDLLETIVMNILRGTGWRGLAPFWVDDIKRPLLELSKAEIVRYAIENDLEWVEDESNYSPRYFRNRLRSAMQKMTPHQRKKLLELYKKQTKIRYEVEDILEHVSSCTGLDPVQLEMRCDMPDEVALEVLNRATDGKLTTPQLKRLLKFIRTSKSGDICQPGGEIQIANYKGGFSITNLPR